MVPTCDCSYAGLITIPNMNLDMYSDLLCCAYCLQCIGGSGLAILTQYCNTSQIHGYYLIIDRTIRKCICRYFSLQEKHWPPASEDFKRHVWLFSLNSWKNQISPCTIALFLSTTSSSVAQFSLCPLLNVATTFPDHEFEILCGIQYSPLQMQ